MSLGRLSVLALALVAPMAFAGCAELAQQAADAAVDAAGCVDASGAQATDTGFQYGGAVSCKTASESYDWSNPSPYADVQWGGSVVSGSIGVRVLDSAGREVYTYDIDAASAEGAQARSAPGFPSVPGVVAWTIELEFRDFTGAMGLQLFAATSPPAAPA